MLPKKIRASSSLVDAVFTKGQRSYSLTFDLLYKKSEKPYSLFAVSVSKKAAKTSVERHKLRRICYNTMGLIHLREPFVCVLIIKKPIIKKEIQNIPKTIIDLFNNAQLVALS